MKPDFAYMFINNLLSLHEQTHTHTHTHTHRERDAQVTLQLLSANDKYIKVSREKHLIVVPWGGLCFFFI